MTLSKNKGGAGSSDIIATSSLLDIGTRREQCGTFSSTVDSNQSELFPLPFKEGTVPVVTLTLSVNNNAGAFTISLVNGLTDHTQFTVNRNNEANNSDNPVVNWVAIGVKP